MLRRLEPGEFVQGTIFTCGLSDSYPDVPALGVLITARCDTAQDKAAVYNYVPLIPIEAWIAKDGLELVAKRALANEMGTLRRALTDVGMAPSILEFVALDDILVEMKVGSSKQEKAAANRFEQACVGVRKASLMLEDTGRALGDVFAFLDANEGLYKSVVRELMTNALSEFHYVERTEPGEVTRGYVVLMREIRFISSALGKQIAVGLGAAEFELMRPTFSPGLNHIRFSTEHDFAMPLSCIASPFIELIMQRFANLFSRIGVVDVTAERITEVHSWVKDMMVGAK